MPAQTTKGWTGVTLGGRYRVGELLGEGGMGFVYHARDARLDIDVVIKVPRRELFGSDGVVQRFILEARSLVKLNHPHIVKITDAGQHEGLPYIVMQYLAGGDLAGRLSALHKQGQCPAPAELVSWLAPIARALDFIHERGYVHRDIKPANIIFDDYGHPYLSDFGIAKGLQAEVQAETRRLTSTGTALGTPDYMAPELIMGQAIDGRADQYALAVVVFEALCGRPPFDGPTVGAIMVMHTSEEPPNPSEFNTNITSPLNTMILRALAKAPADRFASVSGFVTAVSETITDAPFTQASTHLSGKPVTSAVTETRGTQSHDVPTQVAQKTPCPSCGKSLSVPPNTVGRIVECPSCKQRLRVTNDLRLSTDLSQQVTTTNAGSGPVRTVLQTAKLAAPLPPNKVTQNRSPLSVQTTHEAGDETGALSKRTLRVLWSLLVGFAAACVLFIIWNSYSARQVTIASANEQIAATKPEAGVATANDPVPATTPEPKITTANDPVEVTTLIKSLEFNVDGALSSSEAVIDYEPNSFGITEQSVFAVQNGVLQQRTMGLNGSANYTSVGNQFSHSQGLTMEVRLRILDIESEPDPNNPGAYTGAGAYFGARDGVYAYQLNFEKGGVFISTRTGFEHVSFDTSDFHTYRIVSPGNSDQLDLFIDGQHVRTVQAFNYDANCYYWGDGRSIANNGANADWDYVRIYQGQPPRATGGQAITDGKVTHPASKGIGAETIRRNADNAPHTAKAHAIVLPLDGPLAIDGIANSTEAIHQNGPNGVDTTGPGSLLVTSSFAAQNGQPASRGLPDDGFFPATARHPQMQLRYRNKDNGNNLIRLFGRGTSVSIDVANLAYTQLDLAILSGQSPSTLRVDLVYTDGTVALNSTVADWYEDELSSSGELVQGDATLYYLRDGMDRVSDESYQVAADPALFGLGFAVDPNRILSSITVTKTNGGESVLSVLGGTLTGP